MCELHGFDDIIDDVDDFEKYDPVRDADTRGYGGSGEARGDSHLGP